MRSRIFFWALGGVLAGACTLLVQGQNVESCEEGAPARCDGNTLVVCDQGFEIEVDCGAAICNPDAVTCGSCGDGHVDAGEQCDDGNFNAGDGCDAACVSEFCGDGLRQSNEDCDDGNAALGDGCDANCRAESGHFFETEPNDTEAQADGPVRTNVIIHGNETPEGVSQNSDFYLIDYTGVCDLRLQVFDTSDTETCEELDAVVTFHIGGGTTLSSEDGGVNNCPALTLTEQPAGLLLFSVLERNDTDYLLLVDQKGGQEICNGLDDNCDGFVDEGCDDDVDGYCDKDFFVASTATSICPKSPRDAQGDDCNDNVGAINVGALEQCGSTIDENCVGGDNDGCDDDQDGFCDKDVLVVNAALVCPSSPNNTNGTDCDDTVGVTNPSALERCDNLDNNCDGQVDEGCDDDNDNRCDVNLAKAVNVVVTTCTETPANFAIGDDCDDTRGNVKPGLQEICDNFDNDCSGGANGIDTGCDDDNDNRCDAALPKAVGVTVTTCTETATAATQGDDCDDTRNNVKPGQQDICDNLDNDCSGGANGIDTGCDNDNDDFCDATLAKEANLQVAVCPLTPANATLGNDCDDTAVNVNPNGVERCGDGIDSNCVGGDNEGCDDDNDNFCDSGFFVVNAATAGCPNSLNNAQGNDCNDAELRVFPGAHEFCDGVDQDCDGLGDPSDGNADETCGALKCIFKPLLGEVSCGCTNSVQCQSNGNGNESCNTNTNVCDCNGAGPGIALDGQGCNLDAAVDVCSIDQDCALGLFCTGGTAPDKFCK